jgi:phage/plasmid-like protein (TIGR03299 family)
VRTIDNLKPSHSGNQPQEKKQMAHNIWIDESGKEHAAYARVAAWHGLGTVVPHLMTAKQTMEAAGLAWTVDKRQLSWNGAPVDAYGIFRETDNQMLGVVTDFYKPIQNADCFKDTDLLLEAVNGSHYEAAGALGKGETIWTLARIPVELQIKGTDDKSECYLLQTTAHNGKGSKVAKIVTTRVVCQNTLQIAMGEAGSYFRIGHFGDVKKKMKEARKVMGDIIGTVKTLEEKMNLLATRKMTKQSFVAILDKLYPPSDIELEARSSAAQAAATRRQEKLAEIAGLFSSNDNNAFPEIRGTAYNMLNAITEYTDHFSGTDSTRGRSAMFGAGQQLKATALETILEVTADAPVHTIGTAVLDAPDASISELERMFKL